jgi:LysM repeat protein
MKSAHHLSAAIVVVALAACAPKQAGYDTPGSYGTPDGGHAANVPYQPIEPVNPTYDTPAAYEESSAPSATAGPVVPPTPGAATPAAPAAGHAATTHTVVAGDTLGGIALKYKVPMASIMKANNMTKDTVVLGRKLVIPAR